MSAHLPMKSFGLAAACAFVIAAGPSSAQSTTEGDGIVTDIQESLIDDVTVVSIEDAVSAQLPLKGLDLCEIAKASWDAELGDLLLGNWTLTNGIGRSIVGTVETELTDETETEITIFRRPGQGIVITGAPLPETVPLTFYKGEAWPFTVDGGVLFETQDILYDTYNTMPLDCESGDLPRLRAAGGIILPEGVGDFDLYMYVLGKNDAYGATVMELVQPNGQPIEIVRFVSLSRNTE